MTTDTGLNLTELGYIVVGSTDLDRWRTFAADILGAMPTGGDDTLRIRLDELAYRILVIPAADDRFLASGWIAADPRTYDEALTRVSTFGIEVSEGDDEHCAQRGVAAYFSFADPSGNINEICWGRSQAADPFVSQTGVSGFVTDEMGLGHVVLPCAKDYDATLRFYMDVFGFGIADFFAHPAAAHGVPGPRANFLYARNPRQHSLAVVNIDSPVGLNHFMLEVRSLDDVGRALDRAHSAGLVRRTLGRHVNDGMVSFYVQTPGGFFVEYGYDGMRMNWDSHEVRQIPRGSHWGHQWL